MKQWFRKLGSALFIVMLGGMLLGLLYQLYSALKYHVIYGGRSQGWPSYDSRPIAFWWSVILCCFGTLILTVAIPYFIRGYFFEEKYWRRRETKCPRRKRHSPINFGAMSKPSKRSLAVARVERSESRERLSGPERSPGFHFVQSGLRSLSLVMAGLDPRLSGLILVDEAHGMDSSVF